MAFDFSIICNADQPVASSDIFDEVTAEFKKRGYIGAGPAKLDAMEQCFGNILADVCAKHGFRV